MINQDNQAGGVKLEAKALEAGQRAAMVSNGCGATLEGGEHVFCTDARLPDGVRCPDCSCQTDATAAITAFLAAIPAAGAVPSGWKLVPAEPTPDMWLAGNEAFRNSSWHELSPIEIDASVGSGTFAEVYRAMLAASPPSPSGGEPEPVTWSTTTSDLNCSGLHFVASPSKPSEVAVERAARVLWSLFDDFTPDHRDRVMDETRRALTAALSGGGE